MLSQAFNPPGVPDSNNSMAGMPSDGMELGCRKRDSLVATFSGCCVGGTKGSCS